MNIFSLLFSNTPSSKREKIKWFLINLKNGGFIKKRSFQKIINKNKNDTWREFSIQFKYVYEYYPAKRILNSPIIKKTMFDINSPLQKIKESKILEETNNLAKSIEQTFDLSENQALGWVSTFGAILEEGTKLNNKIMNLMRTTNFIEFGPGLGLAGQLYSRLFGSKAIFFDLPEVSNVRSLVLKEYYKTINNNNLFPEEFTDISSMIKRSQKLSDYFFISTWAFTESPLEIREKFFNMINNASIILIVSNPRFEKIDNFLYLEDLSKRLKMHKHIKRDLSFLKDIPNYLKRHQLHLFIKDINK